MYYTSHLIRGVVDIVESREEFEYTQVRDFGFDNKGTGGERETIRWRGKECALLLANPPPRQWVGGMVGRKKRVICSNERHKNILYNAWTKKREVDVMGNRI